MAATTDESMIRFLFAGVLESAVNIALAYEPLALERLRDHRGRVVRVKTTRPDLMFFIAICEDGVQFYSSYEERVDARITLPSSVFSQSVLGQNREDILELPNVRFSGDESFLRDVLQTIQQFSLWDLVKQALTSWFPEYESFQGLFEALKRNDPAWIVRLEHLPQMANETLMAVRTQGELLHAQTKELERLKDQLASDRRTTRISTMIGFALIIVAFLAHNDVLAMAPLQGLSLDSVLLLILSMALLIPRLINGR